MSIFFPNIHARIRKQMLEDIAIGVDSWEIRAKATQMLLDGCFVDCEIVARRLANAWYECLTHTDLPTLASVTEPV